jgi:hypothetical protein
VLPVGMRRVRGRTDSGSNRDHEDRC